MPDLRTRLVSGLVFPLQERLKKHSTVADRRAMEDSQWWPRERLEALRVQRLRALLDLRAPGLGRGVAPGQPPAGRGRAGRGVAVERAARALSAPHQGAGACRCCVRRRATRPCKAETRR